MAGHMIFKKLNIEIDKFYQSHFIFLRFQTATHFGLELGIKDEILDFGLQFVGVVKGEEAGYCSFYI
ncbi:unnamed protein product [Rhizophagus irregularis]|nr:unnamed protein product [Rhizophagus irregularis]CAB5362986.1 unnamed protein product [Rhizophagus irregularis]